MKYENNKIVYEVGDWVRNDEHNETARIRKIEGDYYFFDLSSRPDLCKKVGVGSGWHQSSRPATQEEIDKISKEDKIMVGGYEVKFFGSVHNESKNEIKVGCVEVSKELFLKIGKKAGWL